jgi:GTPase
MTLYHIILATAFDIPIIVVLTKINNCPKHTLKHTKEEIVNIIHSPEDQKGVVPDQETN